MVLAGLCVSGHRHGALEHVAARDEGLAQPDRAPGVVAVENAAERDGGWRALQVVLCVPTFDVRGVVARQETEEVCLVHRRSGCFYPDDTRTLRIGPLSSKRKSSSLSVTSSFGSV